MAASNASILLSIVGLLGNGQMGGGCSANPNCTCLHVLILFVGARNRNTVILYCGNLLMYIVRIVNCQPQLCVTQY